MTEPRIEETPEGYVVAGMFTTELAMAQEMLADLTHDITPDDDPEDGNRCKTCGRPITWIGPSVVWDWQHIDSPFT